MIEHQIVENLSREIEELSGALEKIKKTRLTERALILLIHDALPGGGYGRGKICGLPAIKAVLESASNLKAHYFKKAADMKGEKQ